MNQSAQMTMNSDSTKSKKTFFSWPLFKQSIKANLTLWLVLAIGSAAIFVIVNLVIGTKTIFTNIDVQKVSTYVQDEGMSWVQILGLLQTMGFSLSRIQVMSQMDLNAILNSFIYKLTGILLPMIYVMIVANKLLSAQVSDGSMAYVLSTPTNRKKVVRTQFLFLFLSLTAMYVVIIIGALGSGVIANYIVNLKAEVETPYDYFMLKTFLYCFASYVAMFAVAGICFFSSAIFNKSSKSIAFGGGICVFFFICCLLGIFGTKVFVSVGIGVEAMNVFNYMTLYTFIDTDSLTEFSKYVTNFQAGENSLRWIWELGILTVIGLILPYIGSKIFIKKDLPL